MNQTTSWIGSAIQQLFAMLGEHRTVSGDMISSARPSWTGRLLDLADARQRWRLLAVLAIISAAAFIAADRITLALERSRVTAGLDRLFANSKLVEMGPRYIQFGNASVVSMYLLEGIRAGSEMLLAEIQLTCGTATLLAADGQGRVLSSARDFRYLEARGPGTFRFVLTVFASMTGGERYNALLRHEPSCAPGHRFAALHNQSRMAWDGPPLSSVFRSVGGVWTANPGAGPQWVGNKPNAEWVTRALNDGP